ncbi:MAG: hypothetical protein AB1938_13820 [Myxococcota bacterium]
MAAAPPVLMGGAPTPGTYHLTSRILYTGVGGDAGLTGKRVRDSVALTGAAMEWAYTLFVDGGVSEADGGSCGRFSGAVALDGGFQLAVTWTCGLGPAFTDVYDYSATGNTLVLGLRSSPTVLTFTRQ